MFAYRIASVVRYNLYYVMQFFLVFCVVAMCLCDIERR